VVELRDFDDNLASDDSATVVRVEIVGGDNLARFVDGSDQTVVDSSTSTITRQAASGGVVRFSNLRLVGTPGVEYQLRFTANPDDLSADYTSNPSNALVLAHADPASLSVTTNPVGNMTNTALTTQPALRLLDRYGNLATSDNSTVVSASLFESTGGVISTQAVTTFNDGRTILLFDYIKYVYVHFIGHAPVAHSSPPSNDASAILVISVVLDTSSS
jgi:hypothetical protein